MSTSRWAVSRHRDLKGKNQENCCAIAFFSISLSFLMESFVCSIPEILVLVYHISIDHTASLSWLIRQTHQRSILRLLIYNRIKYHMPSFEPVRSKVYFSHIYIWTSGLEGLLVSESYHFPGFVLSSMPTAMWARIWSLPRLLALTPTHVISDRSNLGFTV